MSWDVALNCRATLGYTTDGAGHVACLGEQYPVTKVNGNGDSVTFGWNVDNTSGARDRQSDSPHTPRFAGMNFVNDISASPYLRIDVPALGTYTIHVALGDANGASQADFQFYDGASTLLFATTGSISADHYKDATDADLTNLTWPGSEIGATVILATTQFRIYPKGVVGNRCIAHVRLVQVAISSTPKFGQVGRAGGGRIFRGQGGTTPRWTV